MKDLKGKYNSAKVFTDNIDEMTESQIVNLLDQSFVAGSKIRIMPDTHAGKGCVIGTTMTITDKVVPNLVGVDIGCGVDIYEFTGNLDLKKLDEVIRAYVPSGTAVRGKVHQFLSDVKGLDSLTLDIDAKARNRVDLSLGTLGGGNHFIEVNEAKDGRTFLSVHSGSRGLGVRVAKHHQDIAISCNMEYKVLREELIAQLKAENRHNEIQSELSKFDSTFTHIPKELAYLSGENLENYLHDMRITQQFASLNRDAMVDVIMQEMGWKQQGAIKSTHNYIDFDDMVLRKGAIRADKGMDIVVPINMRDGSIIARGKGNADWNNSSPHGAGRILSRTRAKNLLDLDTVKEQMSNVFTTSLSADTLDEAPDAYKPLDEIIQNTVDTLEIVDIVRPVYNFKASE